MPKVVSKGRDVNEAITIGLQLLDATKKEVDIEILQQESRGFMGIRGKQAVVKLTKLERETSASNHRAAGPDLFDAFERYIDDEERKEEYVSDPEPAPASLAGKVWVKDGEIQFVHSPDHFPMVTIGEGIELYRNDVLMKEKTIIVSEGDHFEVKVKSEEKETKWSVTVDAHKLKVEVKVQPGYKITRSIQDTEPADHITLAAKETKQVQNTLQYADLMTELEALRVIHGFHQDQMIKATETEEEGTFVIAEGIKPQPGKDGWIELMIDVEDGTGGPQQTKDGRVDFRETKSFPSAERGQVIAAIHPPVPGKMGYTVTNEPLPAKQTHPIVLRAGNGVSLAGDKVIAVEAGRPHVEIRGKLVKLAVLPKLVHQGNVNLTSGNIRFKGDVEVTGEVEDGMTVEAEGDLTVHKTVNNATLRSSGAIVTFGNIISSDLTSGKNNLLIAELGQLIGNIYRDVDKITAFIHQLTLSPAFKSSDFSRGGLQPLIRILLEKKFMDFPSQVKKYVELVRNGGVLLADDDWSLVGGELTHFFLSLTNDVTSLDKIKELSMKMKALHELSITPAEQHAYITIPNALNSKIYCSGNILVLGKGVINTKMHSSGKLKVSGVVRGGEVYGECGVEINEAGAVSGTPTLITVPSNQTIAIKKVMEGTIIKIGQIRHIFDQTTYQIHAHLNPDGKLLLN